MSLIYGIIAIEGVASKESAQCLKDELSRYPTDEYHEISEVDVVGGLYSIRLRKAPFPQEKCLVDENGLFLFADARLDYRKELIQKLGLQPSAEFQLSDTELILKAYQKWNRDCIKYLEGDFSFVLYDSEKKEIWAARDPIGFRPLFFIQKDDQFYFSSSLKGLLRLQLFRHGPNWGKVIKLFSKIVRCEFRPSR